MTFSPRPKPHYDARTALAQLPVGTKIIWSNELDRYERGLRVNNMWVIEATGIRWPSGDNIQAFDNIRPDFPYTVVESATGEVFYRAGSNPLGPLVA